MKHRSYLLLLPLGCALATLSISAADASHDLPPTNTLAESPSQLDEDIEQTEADNTLPYDELKARVSEFGLALGTVSIATLGIALEFWHEHKQQTLRSTVQELTTKLEDQQSWLQWLGLKKPSTWAILALAGVQIWQHKNAPKLDALFEKYKDGMRQALDLIKQQRTLLNIATGPTESSHDSSKK